MNKFIKFLFLLLSFCLFGCQTPTNDTTTISSSEIPNSSYTESELHVMLKNDFEEFYAKTNNATNYMYSLVELDGYNSSKKMKYCADPFYYEYNDGNNRTIYIIEDNRIFSYKFYQNYYLRFEKHFYTNNVEEFFSKNKINYFEKLNSFYVPSNSTIYMEEDSYIIKTKFKYIHSEEIASEARTLLRRASYTNFTIDDAYVLFTIKFSESDCQFTIKVNEDHYNTELFSTEFEKVDVFNYKSSLPSCPDDVIEMTDLSKPIFIDHRRESLHYVKGFIKKGIYAPYDVETDEIFNFSPIEVCDEQKNKLPSLSGYANIDMYSIFNIPEDGYYYLGIPLSSRDKTIVIKNIEELCQFDICNPKDLFDDGFKGKLISSIDFHFFVFESDKEQVIKLNNNTEYVFSISSNKTENSFDLNNLTYIRQGIYYLRVLKGINYFNLDILDRHLIEESDYPIEYDFKVELFDYELSLQKPFEELEKITTEPSKKVYASGYGYEYQYLAFTAEKDGHYHFHTDVIGGENMGHQFLLLKMDGTYIYPSMHGCFEIEQGDYYVIIYQNDHIFTTGNIWYEYIDN